ncbi:hypothetical protein C8J34_104136 [Rhizobium sp. PP-F2F-G36]|nr:hypothetical protein C8J34_104136 [Rhizobium sp. PP-F2F-G36]
MKQFVGHSYPNAAAPPHALYLVGRDGIEEAVTVANLDWRTVHAGIDASLVNVSAFGGIPYAERADGLDSSIMEYDTCQQPTSSSTVYAVYVYDGPEEFGLDDVGKIAAEPLAHRLFEIVVYDAEEEYLEAVREVQEVAGDSFAPSAIAVEKAISAAYDASLVCRKFGTFDPREFTADIEDALRRTPYRQNCDGDIVARIEVGGVADYLQRQSDGTYTIAFRYSIDGEKTWAPAKEIVHVAEDGEPFLEDGEDRLLSDLSLTSEQIAAVEAVLEDALAWIDGIDLLDVAETEGQ